MDAVEFSGPGLTTEQWNQINALAESLQPNQALWLSGYFAALDRDARTTTIEPAGGLARHISPSVLPGTDSSTRSLTILFGGETGNSATLAQSLADTARAYGIRPVVADMADYKVRKLKDEQDLLVISSTHGEGDPPQPAKAFFEFLASRKAPKLSGTHYAVLALGDSTYARYCEAGKELDRRFAELGATPIEPRVDCDVDYDATAATWIARVLEKLTSNASTEAKTTSGASSFNPSNLASFSAITSIVDKRHPATAIVVENIPLTGHGSSKETRHIELSLADSRIVFEPGDALGVLPRNDPALLDAIIETLSLSHDAPITVKERSTTLGEALATDFEIAAATPRMIDHWAQVSGAAELEGLRGDDKAAERATYLRGHHVIDIIRRFPVRGIDPQIFVAGLRPLQPRLYSIASSQAAAPDEVHLTVSTVRYELNGEPRSGVTSGYFAERAAPDTTIPVYVQGNPHFRLADDDASILMIGAGTGVAPYRAFLQEREARGARGKSWLFFGERNFHTDFLYQTEWQNFLKEGVLSRMNVAFSRDRATKTYVQHRLNEYARDVYRWLQDGAHVYVCGDATNLAPDVHAALRAIVQQEGGLGQAATDNYFDALQREHRYQIDVY